MIITNPIAPFEDAVIIYPSVHYDIRGYFIESYDSIHYGKSLKFVQDNVSISKNNVLRGIHGNYTTWKLIQCVKGIIYFVIIDLNPKSITYKQHAEFWLGDNYFDVFDELKRNEFPFIQFLIPPYFGVGTYTTSEESILLYKQSKHFNKKDQFTIKWNDEKISKLFWPVTNPILSERDTIGPFLDLQ